MNSLSSYVFLRSWAYVEHFQLSGLNLIVIVSNQRLRIHSFCLCFMRVDTKQLIGLNMLTLPLTPLHMGGVLKYPLLSISSSPLMTEKWLVAYARKSTKPASNQYHQYYSYSYWTKVSLSHITSSNYGLLRQYHYQEFNILTNSARPSSFRKAVFDEALT